MATDPLAGITCQARPVLNTYEQTLYNLCEEYFITIQRRSNRHPVLSQVRLVDAINVSAPNSYIGGIQFTAFSFDILITDGQANPIFAFEADGPQHHVQPQLGRDQLKDAIAKKAGITVIRLLVDGMMPPLDVVRAEAEIEGFDRELEYPTTDRFICYSTQHFPDALRTITLEDIELALIRVGWTFPSGWEFVTRYELR